MALWTTISNALVAVGAKPFATTMQALRDNPVAIAEGAAGAPKIKTAALETAERMTTGNVLGRTASLTAGAVGSYAMLSAAGSGADIGPGGTLAGSSLRYSNARGELDPSATLPGTTWRCLGRADRGALADKAPARVTLWVRIS